MPRTPKFDDAVGGKPGEPSEDKTRREHELLVHTKD